ncbi:MAG TPA: ABC transporter permease [Pyrinomonadaceae bacterium]
MPSGVPDLTVDGGEPRGGGRRVTVIGPPSLSLSSLFGSVRKLAHYRDLLHTLSVHRVRVRYKQSALGIAWAIIQPLSLMLIYTLIFSLVAKVPSRGMPYAVFAYAALVPWTMFANALTNASNSLVSHSQLVTKVYFPREILPVTYVAAALFDLLIASTVLVGMMIYYRVGVNANVLYVAPVVLLLSLFTTAVALMLSALQVRFRDIGVAMPLLLQLWMFATPVIYPLDAVPGGLRPLYVLNPMVGIVENFRRAVLEGAPPDFGSLGISALVTLALLPCAYVYFKRADSTVADVI